jgi:predicted metal-binding protein
MAACKHACTAAFSAPNKLTFMLSQLSSIQSIPELLQFSQQYIVAPGGKVPYKERPELIKQKLYAVLPPLPTERSQ